MRTFHLKPTRFRLAALLTTSAVIGMWGATFVISDWARAAAPAFVQVVATMPQTAQTTVTVKYSKAQVVGDTNVLAIGTADTTSTITSVADSSGNTYAVAAPLTRGSSQSQAIYYAKNIKAAAANANTVTVKFNVGAAFVDLRASEYSGLDTTAPLDVASSGTGNGSSATTPAMTTSFSNELIFGAGDTSGTFSAAGSGFTKRIITNPDADITEDKTVTAIGSYSAIATQSGAWVMQMVAFKAAGSTPDTTPPSVPTGLQGTAASQSQVNLTWTASTDNVGVTGYRVFRNGTQVGAPTSTSFSDTGLTAGNTYAYTVAAVDAAGNSSAQSTGANVTTPAPDTTAPSVPTGLSATAVSASEIDLAWSAATDNVGVTGYKVYRGGSLVTTVTGLTYKNTGLAAGTSYNYTVSAIDAVGNESAQSATVSATTTALDTTPPSVPTGVSANAVSQTQVNLSWTASTDNVGVTGYKVYRNAVQVGAPTSVSFSDTGLAAGTTYAYTVAAVDAAGNVSAQSTAVNGTTQAPDTTPPSVPTGVSVGNATGTQLTVSWSASTDNVGVTGYKVYRGGALIATTINLTYQDSSLTSNTTYSYMVSAIDAAGNESAQTAAVSGTTLAATGFPFVKSVSANHRYLLDQFGNPFLMVGDSPHSVATRLTEAQADTYFANRQSHGVNSAWVEVLVDGYAGGNADGSTYDGIVPFTTPNDFSTPNPVYFQRVKDMVHIAAQHGVTVFLDTLETAGWASQYQSNGATKDYNFGVYLGNLFKNEPNIVWITGNDYGGWWDPVQDNEVTSVAKGAASVDPNHLQTVQLNGTISSSLDDPNWASIINLNGVYTYYPTYDETLHAYNQTPTMPVYMQEANYEFENNTNASYPTTNETLRRQSWWTITSGGVAGQMYGNGYTWDEVDWPTEQAHLDTPGVIQMKYWSDLLTARPWYNLVPDQTHAFLTAGYGTYDSAQDDVLQSDYVTGAVTPDGTFGLVYTPVAHTLTVNLNKMSGPTTVRWLDPSNNTFHAVAGSPFASGSGSQQFTTPGSNADGNGDWVLVLDGSAAPDTTPPSVPTGLTVTSTTGNTANLSWTASTDNFGVAGYKVYRAGVQVGTTTSTSFQDSGLTPNTTYAYTVAAYDFANNVSAQSAAANATTVGPDTTAPSVPAGLAANSVSTSEIDLSWSAATDNVGVTGYKVYRNGSVVGTTTGALTFKDTGLTAGTSYSYTVSAVDAAANESAQSTAVNATTQAPDTTPPSVPTGLTVTNATSTTASLSWTASTDNVGVSSYKVYRNGSLVTAVGTTSFNDTGLTAGTTYTYTVSAYDAMNNESAQSAPVNATTTPPDTTPPSVPAGLAVTGTTNSTVSLSWTASTDDTAVTGYQVFRNGMIVGTTASTTFTDNGLLPITSYTYTVAAFDAAGNVSAQTAGVTATTGAPTVTNPTFVQLNSTTPQTAQTSVPVAYTQAQTAGNLNVVVVGFYSSTSTVSSVTDSAGNTYVLAAPLTRQNATSQAIYYAKNIKAAAAGANLVTVTFSASTPYPDIRIVEYAGLDAANPFDATNSGAGFPTTATSGNVTTTKPVELLFGAGDTAGMFSAAGSGYTLRVITTPDGDIVEDRVATSTGAYAATAANSSDEVMQVVAFKAAGQ